MVLADRLVIVENGRVVQEGAPTEVARRPRTDYVAQLVGLNLYRGTASGTTVGLTDGGTHHRRRTRHRPGLRGVPTDRGQPVRRTARPAARATPGRPWSPA